MLTTILGFFISSILLLIFRHAAVLKKSSNTMMGLATFIGLGWIYIASNMYPDGSASCCNCHCHGSKPEVQQNQELQILWGGHYLFCERESNLLYSQKTPALSSRCMLVIIFIGKFYARSDLELVHLIAALARESDKNMLVLVSPMARQRPG